MQTHIFQQGTVSCCNLGGAIKVTFLRKASEKHLKIQTSSAEIYCNQFDSSWSFIHSSIRFVQTWGSL